MHHPLKIQRSREEGFTLVELLVVILVIGILSAIAIPMFLNQRKEASMATIKTDLKNAALIMETESVKNGGKYINSIPDYTGFSDGNLVSVMTGFSNTEEICLEGHNTSLNRSLYYSSQNGGLLPEGTSCSPVNNGSSYLDLNQTKKVVILEHYAIVGSMSGSSQYAKKNFLAQGYLEENIIMKTIGTTTISDLEDVEVLAVMAQYWSAGDDLALALEFYNRGGKVLMEGNDSVLGQFVETGVTKNGTGVSFLPTYNKTSPAFPYNFRTDAFGSDSFRCWLTLKNGAVAITNSASGADTCISMFAATNNQGGQFVGLIYAKTTKDNELRYSQTYASISWLAGK